MKEIVNETLPCRLCGELTKEENFALNIDADCGGVTFKNVIIFYCRFDMGDDLSLPQKVCKICVGIVENFTYFCDHIEQNQLKLKNTTSLTGSETISTPPLEDCVNLKELETETEYKNPFSGCEKSIDTDDDSDPLLLAVKSPEKSLEKILIRSSNERKQRVKVNTWEKMFKREIEHLENTMKLENIPESAIAHDGEVDLKVLPASKTWQDLVYGCTHCQFKFEGLNTLLQHFKDDVPFNRGNASYLIKCPDCWETFTRADYVNHALKHYLNLKFTCVCCSKVYQNLFTLLKHYVENHEQTNIYFCLICGLYFCGLLSLKQHKTKKHNEVFKKQMVSRNLNEKSKEQKSIEKPEEIENIEEIEEESLMEKLKTSKDKTEAEQVMEFLESSTESSSFSTFKTRNESFINDDLSEKTSTSTKTDVSSLENRSGPECKKLKGFASSTPESQQKLTECRQKPCPKSKKISMNSNDSGIEQVTKEKFSFKPCPLSKKPKYSQRSNPDENHLSEVITNCQLQGNDVSFQQDDNGDWIFLETEELKKYERISYVFPVKHRSMN